MDYVQDNKLQVALAGAGLFAAAGLGFATWVGAFSKMTVQEATLEGGYLIYTEYRGSVRNIHSAYKPVMADYEEFKKQNPSIESRCVGLYYDDPYNLVNPDEFRACLGFLLANKNEEMEVFFKNKGYKTAEVPTVPTINGNWPYKCSISFMLAPMKFYPAGEKYILANKEKYREAIKNQSEKEVSVEVFEENQVKYYWPLEKNTDYFLTTYPQGQLKDVDAYKKALQMED